MISLIPILSTDEPLKIKFFIKWMNPLKFHKQGVKYLAGAEVKHEELQKTHNINLFSMCIQVYILH